MEREDGAASTSTPTAVIPKDARGSSTMTADHLLDSSAAASIRRNGPSIVLTGFRGIGKSTLGLIIATKLGRHFVDCDRALSAFAKCSPNEYVRKHSWEKFRDLETEILQRLLRDHPTGYIIACGGGVVEREENRALLRRHGEQGGYVVHITREKEDVIKYLVNERDRPQWGEEFRSVWARRFPLFEEYSTHTYVSLTARRDPRSKPVPPSLILKEVERNFTRFIDLILRTSPVPLPPLDCRTYSISVDCPRPQNIDPRAFEVATQGIDAIELRIDSLKQPSAESFISPLNTPSSNPGCPDPTYVAFTIAHIRKLSPLPIIYTIRTVKQGGHFTLDESSAQDYLDLALLAYRLGVEYIDLELELGEPLLRAIMSRKPVYTNVIVSHHDMTNRLRWDQRETEVLYRIAADTKADIVKLSLFTENVQESLQLQPFLQRLKQEQASDRSGIRFPPLIANSTGKTGAMSYLFNTFLSPVSHPKLPSPPRSGQSTFSNVQQALAAMSLTTPRDIVCDDRMACVVGDGVGPGSYARSCFDRAAIIRAGCQTLSLPYTVTMQGSNPRRQRQELAGALVQTNFHDASLLNGSARESIWTDAARWTGVADAVSYDHSVRFSRETHHNVMSVAIGKLISSNLSPINTITDVSTAMIIGCAGHLLREAVYALSEMGVQTVFCLRCDESGSESNSREDLAYMARALGTKVEHHTGLSELRGRHLPNIIMAFSRQIDLDATALTDSLFESPTGGTFLELSYPQLSTPSVVEAVLYRSKHREGWVELKRDDLDAEVLREEFLLMTGYRLPNSAFDTKIRQ